jgi:hypothetical protein
VKVDLLKHEEPRQDERLDGGNAARAVYGEGRRDGLVVAVADAQAAQEPVEVETAVAHPGEQRVSEQIVAAVDIEHAADGVREIGDGVAATHQLRHTCRHPRVGGA